MGVSASGGHPFFVRAVPRRYARMKTRRSGEESSAS